jgi:hypothetical protein
MERISGKKVKCNTCPEKMEVAPDSSGGNCWRCVASGRAFLLPEALERAPSNDTLLLDENYVQKKPFSQTVGVVGGKEVSTKSPRQMLGQTKVIDSLIEKGLKLEEIVKQVHEQIPQYPLEKLPGLVRVRFSHFKRRPA